MDIKKQISHFGMLDGNKTMSNENSAYAQTHSWIIGTSVRGIFP